MSRPEGEGMAPCFGSLNCLPTPPARSRLLPCPLPPFNAARDSDPANYSPMKQTVHLFSTQQCAKPVESRGTLLPLIGAQLVAASVERGERVRNRLTEFSASAIFILL